MEELINIHPNMNMAFKLCMLISALWTSSVVATDVVVSDEDSLNNAVGDNTNIRFNSNIALSANITIDGTTRVVIDGEGYSISGQDRVPCFFLIDSTVTFHNLSMTNGFGVTYSSL